MAKTTTKSFGGGFGSILHIPNFDYKEYMHSTVVCRQPGTSFDPLDTEMSEAMTIVVPIKKNQLMLNGTNLVQLGLI